MPANHDRWLTAQQAAVEMNSTSAEVCRLINIGRLSGIKQKQPGRPGKEQWFIDPQSIRKEKRRIASLAGMGRNRKRATS